MFSYLRAQPIDDSRLTHGTEVYSSNGSSATLRSTQSASASIIGRSVSFKVTTSHARLAGRGAQARPAHVRHRFEPELGCAGTERAVFIPGFALTLRSSEQRCPTVFQPRGAIRRQHPGCRLCVQFKLLRQEHILPATIGAFENEGFGPALPYVFGSGK